MTDPKDINEEVFRIYYQNLYNKSTGKEEEQMTTFLDSITSNNVTEDQTDMLNTLINTESRNDNKKD